jgi:hypothetical protein
MQISKGCSIEFLSARTIWQLVYKEDFKCTRLMRRTLQVVVRQKSPGYPPRLMPIEFQLFLYFHIF